MMRLHHGGYTAETLKLEIALAEAGIVPEAHALDTMALEQWSPAHRALAPNGALPVLESDGLVMAESSFALQYLAEAHTPRLAPTDAWLWYEVQALMQRIDAAIGPAINLIGWHETTPPEARAAYRAALAGVESREQLAGWDAVWADAEATEDQIALAEQRIAGALDELAAGLESAEWLVGDACSIADIDAYALIRAVSTVRPALIAERAALTHWLDRVTARPAVAAFAAQTMSYAPPA